ncbi:uncharacterized protein EDB91DRAFT_1173486 [Suillus paluster]|uniref:uncharacterized protein n=1 Tax=Suillus paluster TaxID=48578 RepID=UPI001B87D6B4|nr:uncharacterized protein EDB91DRAFT_1173486 [Suillus paluster]KAG1723117.1 hypothetical protein EDB91DRAFT_1173486 [Suillus paluster]
MISRFAKSFLAVILCLFLLATVTFLHPPSRTYIDPWTGDFFGEGGVEQDLHPPLYNGAKPLSAQGGVIMSKLGNETTNLSTSLTRRYMQHPTQDERDALNSYFHLTLCSVHNEVNERLGKPSFDCAHLDETYDCGCGEDKSTSTAQSPVPSDSAEDPMDLEWDTARDDVTGVGLIKGGKR